MADRYVPDVPAHYHDVLQGYITDYPSGTYDEWLQLQAKEVANLRMIERHEVWYVKFTINKYLAFCKSEGCAYTMDSFMTFICREGCGQREGKSP